MERNSFQLQSHFPLVFLQCHCHFRFMGYCVNDCLTIAEPQTSYTSLRGAPDEQTCKLKRD